MTDLDKEIEENWLLLFGRKPQAKDISDLMFFSALNSLEVGGRWTTIWDMQENGLRFPIKVIRAKARMMIRKDRGITGCYCGCRGDFELSRPLDVVMWLQIEMMRMLEAEMDKQILYGNGQEVSDETSAMGPTGI